MNKSTSLYFLFTILAITFFSCKKVGDNEKITEPNESIEGYMSTKEGSWWLYASADGEVFKRYATGQKAQQLGLEFDYYESVDTNTNNITPEYFAKNEDKFMMLIDITGNQDDYVMAVVQKDDPKVGDSWSNTKSMTYSGISMDVLIEGKVVAINQTKTIKGQTFNNIVEVENILKAKTLVTPYVNCGTARLWFSQGLGLVKMEINLNVLSFYTRSYSDELIDFHIEE